MPEGPSIVLLKEAVAGFKGKTVINVKGNANIDIKRINSEKITGFKTWGKHFLICFKTFSIRIHLLMFGSYRINEAKEKGTPRLSLQFKKGVINFYTCSVVLIEDDLDEVYDWSADVMNTKWDAKNAKSKLKDLKKVVVCDALLDQQIFPV